MLVGGYRQRSGRHRSSPAVCDTHPEAVDPGHQPGVPEAPGQLDAQEGDQEPRGIEQKFAFEISKIYPYLAHAKIQLRAMQCGDAFRDQISSRKQSQNLVFGKPIHFI
jgi:hypothetical protein